MEKKGAVLHSALKNLADQYEALEDAFDDFRSTLQSVFQSVEDIPETVDDDDTFENRVMNLTMTARDWELFSSMEGVETVAAALNYALRGLLLTNLSSKDIRDAMYRVMDDYIMYGARDTEPEANLVQFINMHRPNHEPIGRWN